MNLRRLSRRSLAALLTPCLLLATAGCSSWLAPKPDESRYWVLSSDNATAGALDRSEPLGTRHLHIGLGPITLPEYLEARHLLVRTGTSQLALMPNDYWAEPLESGFPRALVYDVSQALHTASALLYPWYSSSRVQWAVPIDVQQFETSENGEAVLVARWRVTAQPEGRVVYASESRIVEPVATGDTDSTDRRVAALRRAISRLAADIVAAVEKLSEQAQAGRPAKAKAPAPAQTPAKAETPAPAAAPVKAETPAMNDAPAREKP